MFNKANLVDPEKKPGWFEYKITHSNWFSEENLLQTPAKRLLPGIRNPLNKKMMFSIHAENALDCQVGVPPTHGLVWKIRW